MEEVQVDRTIAKSATYLDVVSSQSNAVLGVTFVES